MVVGMYVNISASYADHTFMLVSNTITNASNIYVTGPINDLDFQVRASHVMQRPGTPSK